MTSISYYKNANNYPSPQRTKEQSQTGINFRNYTPTDVKEARGSLRLLKARLSSKDRETPTNKSVLNGPTSAATSRYDGPKPNAPRPGRTASTRVDPPSLGNQNSNFRR